MKNIIRNGAIGLAMFASTFSYAQEQEQEVVKEQKHESQEIQTLFRGGHTSSGGYGAISNKFTTIRGQYANIVEVYGGWYVDHRLLIGLSASALTNNLPVPFEYRADPFINLSYGYGQVGMITEYVVGSRKAVHATFSLFAGTGFTLQYQRSDWSNDNHHTHVHNDNWFFATEPGAALELNIFKWMRFSTGVSYRATIGSNTVGLTDKDLSNISYNATLKFGKF